MNPLRLTYQRLRFTEQRARYVQNMTAEIGQDELIESLEERLISEHFKAADHIDPRPEWLSDHACSQHALNFADGRLPAPVFVNE